MKTKEYKVLKIVCNTPFGIYKGIGKYPYYGGELKQNGEPGDDLISWPAHWYRTKKDAIHDAIEEANEFEEFINHQNKLWRKQK